MKLTKRQFKINWPLVKSVLFVCFLEETLAWKNHFEFFWPLETNIDAWVLKKSDGFLSNHTECNIWQNKEQEQECAPMQYDPFAVCIEKLHSWNFSLWHHEGSQRPYPFLLYECYLTTIFVELGFLSEFAPFKLKNSTFGSSNSAGLSKIAHSNSLRGGSIQV